MLSLLTVIYNLRPSCLTGKSAYDKKKIAKVDDVIAVNSSIIQSIVVLLRLPSVKGMLCRNGLASRSSLCQRCLWGLEIPIYLFFAHSSRAEMKRHRKTLPQQKHLFAISRWRPRADTFQDAPLAQ